MFIYFENATSSLVENKHIAFCDGENEIGRDYFSGILAYLIPPTNFCPKFTGVSSLDSFPL
jgi:hypothetical protein